MTTYEFTLHYSLPVSETNAEYYLDALANNGCTDAMVGLGQVGQVALAFHRQAESAHQAITSALEDIRVAIPEAKLIEASPDIVGLSDVANLLGFSRQNMRKIMLKNQSHFPIPIHTGKETIWHLIDIMEWFEQRQKTFEPTTLDLAKVARRINIEKEFSKLT